MALAGLPADTAQVDVDMAGVAFMDTAGLGFLDVVRDHGDRHLVPVSATNWNGQPRRILQLAGLDPAEPLNRSARPARSTDVASAVALDRADQLSRREEVEQLRQAFASRPVIDQARGILMGTQACTSHEAWTILREASQLSNTKLRTVAAAVTASAEGDGPPPPDDLRTALRTAIARRAPGGISRAAAAPRASCGRSPAHAAPEADD